MKLLDEARQDFELFNCDSKAYQRKVNGISDLLGLTGDSKLRSDFLPTYLVGDHTGRRRKFVLCGMNPHFNDERNLLEEARNNRTWDRYETFMKEF